MGSGYVDEVMGVYRVHGKGFWQGRSYRRMLGARSSSITMLTRILLLITKQVIENELAKRDAIADSGAENGSESTGRAAKTS